MIHEMVCSLAVPCQPAPTCYTWWTSVIFHFLNNTMSANLNGMAMPNTAGNRSDTMWWALKTKYLLACDIESCRDDNSYSLLVISKLLICRCLVPSDLIGIIRNMIKGLITVGRDSRQQHRCDLLSGAGTSREHSLRDVPAGQQITRVLLP